MPELTPTVLGLLAAMLAMGFILGWIFRGGRGRKEKNAISASWQKQMIAQKQEHDRLADQNKNLMEQISQYRASKKDSDMRAKELSDSMKEAFAKRDELQRQIKEIRSSLEVTIAQRDKFKNDVESGSIRNQASKSALKEKDQKIFKLSRELESWQSRLPPLLERFRLRDLEAQHLESELGKARQRIAALENLAGSDETRIEPIDTNPIADGLDASNDQFEDASTGDEASGPNGAGGGGQQAEPVDFADDDDRTGIDTYLADGTVDFDLGETERAVDADGGDHDAGPEHWSGAEDDEAYAERCIGEEAGGDDDEHATDDDRHAVAHVESAYDDDEDSPETSGEDSLETSGEDGVEAGWEDNAETGDDDGAGELAAGTVNSSHVAATARDDLKLIKGVGPAIEKTLNDLGIYRFNQIAEMSEYDIDRVARELRGFRSRIYREDWIGQARMLQHEKTSGTG